MERKRNYMMNIEKTRTDERRKRKEHARRF